MGVISIMEPRDIAVQLGFAENPDKQGLFSKCYDGVNFAFISFPPHGRSEKGTRFAYKDGDAVKNPDEIPALKQFKEMRDKAAAKPPKEVKPTPVASPVQEPPPPKKVITPEVISPDGALVPAPATSTVLEPLLSAEKALEKWQGYQHLIKKIADTGDFVKVGDKEFPTKQFANKLSKFFGLNVMIQKFWREELEGKDNFTIHVVVRAEGPNGQIRESDGHCHSKERKFAHLQHDVFATAVTRAKSRAIMELAGYGECTAEEVM